MEFKNIEEFKELKEVKEKIIDFKSILDIIMTRGRRLVLFFLVVLRGIDFFEVVLLRKGRSLGILDRKREDK